MRRVCELVAEREITLRYLFLTHTRSPFVFSVWCQFRLRWLCFVFRHLARLSPCRNSHMFFTAFVSVSLRLTLAFTIRSSSIFFFSPCLHQCVPPVSLDPSAFHACVSALMLHLFTVSLRLITHCLARCDFRSFLSPFSHLPLSRAFITNKNNLHFWDGQIIEVILKTFYCAVES